MTTPNVDINIVMPYGVTVEGNGSKFAPPTKPHSQRVGTTGIALPDGPCLVKATWDSNPVDIDVRVLDSTSSIVRKIGTLKTGGGSVMVTVGAKAGWFIQLLARNTLPPGTTGTIEVYPVVSIE